MSKRSRAVSTKSESDYWTPDQVALIKRTIFKGATDDELKLFMHVCERTGLDPFARQIYATKRKSWKTGEETMVIQTSIDGFRVLANRSGAYAGSDDPVYDSETSPKRATVTVYKMVQNERCPFTATARWSEYCPAPPNDFMWKRMPCLMLSKVAEALALRKAFPADLSGVYADEEMDQADDPLEVLPPPPRPTVLAPAPAPLPPPAAQAAPEKPKTQAELRREIYALATEQMRLSDKELADWVFDVFKKESKALTAAELEKFQGILERELAGVDAHVQ